MSFFEQTPTVSRLLYNQDFVAAGCPTEGYDVDFEVDDTVGTWITNFIIFLFGLVAFIKFGSYGCASTPYSKQISALLPYFILNISLAFLVAAVGHIIVDQRSDKLDKTITEVLTIWFFDCSSILLALYGLKLFDVGMDSPQKWKKGIWWTVLVLLSGFAIYSLAMPSLGNASILGMVVYLVTAVSYAVARPELWIVKALGPAVMLAGILVQVFLRGKCGDTAYIDCFENCPLPNPMKFNHNGLFHLVYWLGMVILSVAEDYSPSVIITTDTTAGKENDDKNSSSESEEISETNEKSTTENFDNMP